MSVLVAGKNVLYFEYVLTAALYLLSTTSRCKLRASAATTNSDEVYARKEPSSAIREYRTVFSAVVCMYPRTLGSFFVPSIRTSTTPFITYTRILDEKSSRSIRKKKGLIS